MIVNRITCVALLASLGLLAGCNPPRGTTSGRVDPSISTPAEVRDPRVLPVSLSEFSDQVAMEIAQDLGKRQLAPAGQRATIILGDINNKTQIVSSRDFEYVRSKTRNSLLKSEFVRGKVMWVENRARLAQLAAREGVGTVENPAGPPAYDPRYTYTLNGDMFRISRGTTNLYWMEYQLVNFSTNEIVFSSATEEKRGTF